MTSAAKWDVRSTQELIRSTLGAGSREEAVARLVNLVRADSELHAVVVERWGPSLEEICNLAVSEVARNLRVSGARSALSDPLRDTGLSSSALRVITSLRSWVLPGGARLMTATREEVVEAARVHRVKAAGELSRARFYDRVARRLKPGEVVGSVLTEDALSEMLAEAEGGK
jgi:hypothetical protein